MTISRNENIKYFYRFETLILLSFLLMSSFCVAIDWDDVKPMYLVSMYPRPDSSSLKEAQSASGKPIDSDASGSSHSYSSSGAHRYNNKTTNNNNNIYRNLQNEKLTNYDESFDNADGTDEPVVLNLETKPLRDDMLPGGPVAMDRIFGGNVARRHCFPYQVGLLLQRPKGLYWCGGSLISDQFVLTAAHCVDMAKRALVFLGAHEIKNAKETGQMRIMVNRSSFLVYPTWNPRRLKDDIALVKLPVPIEFSERIHAIQLPKRDYEYRNFKNKLAIASGWGRYATGVHAISGQLRFVKLRIVDGKTCKRSFPLSYRTTNICTSGKQARSTCNGDSGGPLVLQRKRSKKRVLIGVTSFGSIFGCDRGYPAAFTKVASYLDWISDEASIEPQFESTDAALFRRDVKKHRKQKDESLRNHETKRRPPKPMSHLKSYVLNYDRDRNRPHAHFPGRHGGHDHKSPIGPVRGGGHDDDFDADEEDEDDVIHDNDSDDNVDDDDVDDEDGSYSSIINFGMYKYPDAQLLRTETDKFESLLNEN